MPELIYKLIQMNQLREWIIIDYDADIPVYLQITNAFIHNIMNGRLRTGLKLSGSRAVADMLNINRMTMVAAYDELQAQGWIEMIPRKGTYIKKDLPELRPKRISESTKVFSMPAKPMFAFDPKKILPYGSSRFPDPTRITINDGFPDARLAPTDILMRNMRRLSMLKPYRKYLMYGGPEGTPILRETLAEVLRDTRGIPVNAENVLITRGAQMAVYVATSLLIKPGDDMIVGTPGYFGANRTFEQLGAKLNRVPVDDEGINIEAIETVCRKKKVKMIYVIPHHHHPTTVTLTPERRIRLLELALKYKFAIIEDDYDYDFHYASKPMMPMASLDRQGSVIYIGTLTKTLAPAFRIGFMTGPQNFISLAANFRRFMDHQGDSLMENAIAALYKDGTISRHIKKTVKIYKERRDHFCSLLQDELGSDIIFKIPDGGMSVWTRFPKHNLVKLSQQAFTKNLVINNGEDYNAGTTKYNGLRLGFASLNFEEQRKAMDILKSCM
jgi:GntR family transcriptional regulator/MocR family aminotransferase